jgi:peptidoglycan lytic transglycosylase
MPAPNGSRRGRSAGPRPAAVLAIALACLVLTACGHKQRPRVASAPPPPASTSPSATANTPASPIEVPKNAKPIYVETGLASWYGPPYHNRKGANGEVYDMNAATAAHRTIPLNSVVRVTNLANGRSTLVRITDRGPFIEGRILDLSLAAAKEIDVWRAGVAKVKVEVLEAPVPIDKGGRWCVQIGAFTDVDEATRLKDKLTRRYHTARVQQFAGPTGEWIRIRVADDDKRRAEQLANETRTSEGAVFVVRLD